MSLLILAAFVAGVLVGLCRIVPDAVPTADASRIALYVLVFLVGVGIGGSGRAVEVLRTINLKMTLVPLSVIVGTFLGVSAVAAIMPGLTVRHALAVGAGFGYYSLSSVLIRDYSVTLAAVALLANIFREIVTLTTAPLMVRYLFKLAPVSVGGATTMDTTLPIVSRFAGSECAMVCVCSGLVLSLAVPFLVPLILSI